MFIFFSFFPVVKQSRIFDIRNDKTIDCFFCHLRTMILYFYSLLNLALFTFSSHNVFCLLQGVKSKDNIRVLKRNER